MARKKRDNTEFYEKIGDGFDKLLMKIGKKLGLKNLGNKIITWANEHKKAMFGIIITALSIGTMIILIDSTIRIVRPKKDFENPKVAIDSLKNNISNPGHRLGKQVDQYLFMKQYQEELNHLLAKDTLTHQDSVRLIKIYDEIMNMQIQSYYDGKN